MRKITNADIYLSSVSMTGFDYSSSGMMAAVPHDYKSSVLKSIQQTEEIRKDLIKSNFIMTDEYRKAFTDTKKIIEDSLKDAEIFGKKLNIVNTDEYIQFCKNTINFIDNLLD